MVNGEFLISRKNDWELRAAFGVNSLGLIKVFGLKSHENFRQLFFCILAQKALF